MLCAGKKSDVVDTVVYRVAMPSCACEMLRRQCYPTQSMLLPVLFRSCLFPLQPWPVVGGTYPKPSSKEHNYFTPYRRQVFLGRETRPWMPCCRKHSCCPSFLCYLNLLFLRFLCCFWSHLGSDVLVLGSAIDWRTWEIGLLWGSRAESLDPKPTPPRGDRR